MRKMLVLLILVALVAGTLPAIATASTPEPKDDPAATSTGRAPEVSPGVCGVEAGWPGPDGFGYIGEEIAFDWVDIADTGTAVYLADDDHDGPFPIGFAFGFYSDTFTDFYVQSNGTMNFADEYITLSNQCPLPTTGYDTLIAMMWDDLDPGDTSDPIFYQTFDPCPIGAGVCLVVQYENFHHYPGGGAIAGTWETILFDNGEIIIQFEDVGAESGSGSTTGIEDANAGADWGLTYACNEAVLYNGLAMKFGFPEGIFLMPESQSGIQEPGTSADYGLTVSNYTGVPQEVSFGYSAAGTGTCYGPALSDPIDDGGSWPFDVTVEMDPGAVPGDMVNCTVTADADGFSDVSTIDVTAGFPVEAYGQDLFTDNTVYWPDLADPGNWSVVGYTPPSFYAGVDFLGDNYGFMYGLNYTTNEFVTIDTATGAVTVIGTSTPTGNWSGMTGAPDGSALYAVSSVCGTESYLYQVDPATGALTLIGTMNPGSCMIDIAMNADGEMYGVDIIDDSLYQIDPGTGAATLVGYTGVSANYAQGMDFDAETGILYWAAYTTGGELRTLDLGTGMSTLVGGFPSSSEVDGLAIPGVGGQPEFTMHVHDIVGVLGTMDRWIMKVAVADQDHMPLGDVFVEATITTPMFEWGRYRYSKPSGWARFWTPLGDAGDYEICIDMLTLDGYTYNPDDNVYTCMMWSYP